jgi:cytochrome c553
MRLGVLLLIALPLLADDFFEKKVRPVFATKCQVCHGAKLQSGGINFTTAEGFTKAKGKIVEVLSYTGKVKMPPGGKLNDEQVADIGTWIASGAAWPETAAVTKQPEQTHWAFRPVAKVMPPSVSDAKWVKSPIDAFILAKLDEKKLKPAPPASKLVLLRRVTYDLTGLPPSLEEIRAFEDDKGTNVYRKVVDRLMASPRYGEQWGRHWLDVARFADSTGMDEDHIYPHSWRYRDYVVRAFNQDLPYNQFVREQIAGDLMYHDGDARRTEGILATGFLALGAKPLAQQDRMKMIYDVVDEQIDSTSKAFLGLTVACARCHDHKFDPIPTKDYYGLAGIFASTMSFRNLGRPGSVSYINYVPLDTAEFGRYQAHRWRMYATQLELEEAMGEDFARGLTLNGPKIHDAIVEAWKAKRDGAKPASQRWLDWLEKQDGPWRTASAENIDKVAEEMAAAYTKAAQEWDTGLKHWRQEFANEVAVDRDIAERPKLPAEANPFWPGGPLETPQTPRVAFLRAEFDNLKKTLPPEPAMASAVTDGVMVDQRVFPHGDHMNPGEPVSKHFPTAAGGAHSPAVTGSGRRELADWLVSPDNLLTARVIVNRVWMWHFGEGLMRTPNNWGVMGDQPSHPELLDYLARTFVEGGWSIKSLHRQILLSSVYQMDGRNPDSTADPANRLLSHFPRVRMSVEQIRDSFLVLDGTLDPEIGGPVKVKRMSPDEPDEKAESEETRRRTMYMPVRRGSVPVLLSTFDYGDATTVSDGRARTNVAPQALFIMNSDFVADRAKGIAQRLLHEQDLTDAGKVERAYLMVLTRRSTPAEVDEALSYIASFTKKSNRESAWQSFCHVLMSTNEFLYLN